MSRLVPAAKQLTREVDSVGKPSKVTHGDPDSFGFIRDLTFDPRTSKWLVPVLDAIDDPRIDSLDYSGKGRATVRFVADTRADFNQPFGVVEVDRVFREEDDQ